MVKLSVEQIVAAKCTTAPPRNPAARARPSHRLPREVQEGSLFVAFAGEGQWKLPIFYLLPKAGRALLL